MVMDLVTTPVPMKEGEKPKPLLCMQLACGTDKKKKINVITTVQLFLLA